MRKSWTYLCLLAVAMFATKSSANIITVSQFGTADHTSITAAITAAWNNGIPNVDTILVGEGFYGDSLTPRNHLINNERLTIIGAGWDKVRVGGYFSISDQAATETKLVGMLFEYSSYSCRVQNGADAVTIERCRLVGGDNAWSVPTLDLNGGNTRIHDCILSVPQNEADAEAILLRQDTGQVVTFVGCVFTHQAIGHNEALLSCYDSWAAGPTYFTNCVFLNVRYLFWYEDPEHQNPVHVRNCVFYDWSTTDGASWGTYPAGSTFEYIAAGHNSPPYPGNFVNTVALPQNPFDSLNTNNNYVHGVTDLHLNTNANGGNLLRDTGDPNILDLDGTPSDYGVYGGPKPLVDNGVPAYPFVVSLEVPGAVQPASDLNINSAGRVGPHY